jgi:hypothetical protein
MCDNQSFTYDDQSPWPTAPTVQLEIVSLKAITTIRRSCTWAERQPTGCPATRISTVCSIPAIWFWSFQAGKYAA